MRSINLVRVLLFTLVMLALSAPSSARVAVLITIAPPPLPVYVQPPCPAEGYIWIPGYWAYDYDYDDYYWVPGTWVLAPEVGLLWTPPYWAWSGDGFVFHEGYWGPHVGFYGGVVYGFGYFGGGYEGGRWENGQFYYNRSVTNVNTTIIHNIYNTTVVNNTTVNHVSYNGGNSGISARPTQEEEAAAHERHIAPAAVQTEHVQAARADSLLRASVNQGRPSVAATPRPGALNDRAVLPAQKAGGPYKPAPASRAEVRDSADGPIPRSEISVPRPFSTVHPKDLPPRSRPAAPDTGNPKLDRKYQQQQEKLFAKQEQEQGKLEQSQEKEHQRMEQQKIGDARKQQMEERHQQQTQQLEQKHSRDWQKLQEKQHPPGRNQSRPPQENGRTN
jgi:hypothetical protein